MSISNNKIYLAAKSYYKKLPAAPMRVTYQDSELAQLGEYIQHLENEVEHLRAESGEYDDLGAL